MLDNETKRRIDTARDVLVGKVPDPKSQVEQITIALVYKFMDDMDKESVDMGGKPSFFTGDYQRYAWSKIFDPRIGGHEMLGLYGEAIVKLNQNPNIPQLFRDIFKNAYLPYRDPETLKLFLKTINEFNYDHSERLGDAFEYLLSVLGSQGDAGQFRTPRHIIDFMVQVVSPQKHETILDPACGTAGFLISSYKHILKENTKKTPGDLLTTDERKKLLSNFKGYDISPDMVRLSLVNLYLHGFVQPQIMEYDTLTSEDRWNEYADVIMANPPFMSPKGGIKPHKKFSVQSNRSEVLFVDYIAEHLTPTGRAAVIVPEGIIFQSAGAYKQLRKMLVENHLYAVVSLPAGIFNPYSGVKTSILLMDRQIAKKCDSVLFVKIENDGFGLGAQRREQAGSDLPDAINVIADYVKAARSGSLDSFNPEEKPCKALLVKKEKLAENEEYNLTGDRYRTIERKGHQKWPMVTLGEVARIINGRAYKQEELLTKGKYPVLRVGNFFSNSNWYYSDLELEEDKYCDNGDLLYAWSASFGPKIWDQGKVIYHYHIWKVEPTDKITRSFLYHVLNHETEVIKAEGGRGIAMMHITKAGMEMRQIPLPPLEVQREIVAEIESYQKLIDGARQVVESWKPQIEIDPEWPMVKLGEVCERIMDGTHFSPTNVDKGDRLYITAKNIKEHGVDLSNISYITQKDHEEIYKRCPVIHGDVLYIKDGATAGIATINTLKQEFSLLSSVAVMRGEKNKLDNKFLCFYLNSSEGKAKMLSLVGGVAITRLTLTKINEAKIPFPPFNVQQEIVSKIEAERKVVDGCRELIVVYEAKIKQVIDKVWED
ncbi:MAG: N-6 DNA methylase [Firmicutes bacterium]|nr:N-6 DNA methylase [Bacillota bacterium]